MAEQGPHRRLNLLTGEWVLVSPQRTARPWQGQVEPAEAERRPAHDPGCYLCPGNERAGGARTPEYASTYVFDNDYPALLPDADDEETGGDEVLVAEPERGICRVVCYSPRHDLTLGEMDHDAIRHVVDTWVEQYEDLESIDWVRHVQIFENRGSMMGASNPHPHGQIWANESLPNEVVKEQAQQLAFAVRPGDRGCLLCAYVEIEIAEGVRMVAENDEFIAVVPHWAAWPFETLVLPRVHLGCVSDLTSAGRTGLADILRRLARRYDNLFDITFPYSMGLHQRPTDDEAHPEWHLHAHVYPPLLRSATIRKFMVGYELLAQPQRDNTPEEAAGRLVEVGDT